MIPAAARAVGKRAQPSPAKTPACGVCCGGGCGGQHGLQACLAPGAAAAHHHHQPLPAPSAAVAMAHTPEDTPAAPRAESAARAENPAACCRWCAPVFSGPWTVCACASLAQPAAEPAATHPPGDPPCSGVAWELGTVKAAARTAGMVQGNFGSPRVGFKIRAVCRLFLSLSLSPPPCTCRHGIRFIGAAGAGRRHFGPPQRTRQCGKVRRLGLLSAPRWDASNSCPPPQWRAARRRPRQRADRRQAGGGAGGCDG